MERKKLGITGHQNIPKEAIKFIQDGIKNFVLQIGCDVVGVSSLAAGSDQIFAEIIINLGFKLHVIIPSNKYESTFSDPKVLEKFNSLFDKAMIKEELDYSEPSEEAFLNAGYHVVNESDILLAIWDGQKAQGKGGTADIVQYAKSKNKELFILWPEGAIR